MKPAPWWLLVLALLAACGGPAPAPPAPSATAEPTATPRAAAEATARPAPTATGEPAPSPPAVPDAETLSDGWRRYPVPDAEIALELPGGFYVLPLDEATRDTLMSEAEARFPTLATQFDLRALVAGNVRLLALDVQALENGATFVPNLTVLTQELDPAPLELVLAAHRGQMEAMGLANLGEPERLTVDGQEAAIIEYDLEVEGATVHGAQLYLMRGETLHVVTASFVPDERGDYAALVRTLFQRIQIQ